MGGKTQTTTQQQTNTPTGLAQLGDIWNRVQQVASTPYQAYNGQLVAGLTPTQQQGIQGVTNAQGSAQPYFDQAAQYATQGASTIDPSSIQKYMNPYTQNVIDATQANFNQSNAIQQQGVIGNAAAQGALGGDRVGVAQSELARQQGLAQNPVIAGLQQQNYSQALGAAQADRSAAAQGAYTFGALAPSVQNSQISGAQAQIGAGGLEQGTNQAQLTAAYNQYLQQQAFPYQQAGFLASAGLPAATAMGGTSNGTTTSPGPNPWVQAAGLGLGAAAALAKDGGRITKAGGGPVNFSDIPTYIPRFSQMGGGGSNPFGSAPKLPSVGQSNQNQYAGFTPAMGKKAASGLSGLFGGGDTTPTGFTGNSDVAFSGVPDATTSFQGGIPYPMFGEANGGRVGYADGGDVIDLSPNDYVRQAFGDTRQAIDGGLLDPQGANALGPSALQGPSPASNPMLTPIASNSVPLPAPRPPEASMAPSMGSDQPNPMAMGSPDESPDAPQDMADDTAIPSAAEPTAGTLPFGSPSQGRKGLLGLNLSDDARMGLLAAGLGIAASRSPFALSAIGEGGLQGVKTYTDQKAQRQKADQEASRLAQQATQFAQNLDLHKDTLAENIRRNTEAEAARKQAYEESVRQHGIAAMQPVKIGSGPYGDVFGIRDPKNGTIIPLDPTTGKPAVPPQGAPSPAEPNYVIPGNSPASKGQISATTDEADIPREAIFTSNDPPTAIASTLQPQALNDLSPKDVETVRAIAEGRRPALPLQRNNLFNRMIMDHVGLYNPNYDQTMFSRRQQTANAFSKGVEGRNVTAMNTWAQHMDEYLRLTQDLNLGRFTSVNDAYNWMTSHGYTTKDAQKKLGALEIASKAVADEGAKVFAGTNSALADREEWQKRFGTSTPADVAIEKAKEAEKLVEGRLSSLTDQYNRGMQTGHGAAKLIAPETQEIISRIRNTQDKYMPKGAATPSLSDTDKQALDWANSNGSDPRSVAIKKRLGVQ